jgi:hypothetical protein
VDDRVTVQDRLTLARVDLVELRRACEWLHYLYWDKRELSYAKYIRQCRENEAMLIRLIGRIRDLEREATGAGQTDAAASPPA